MHFFASLNDLIFPSRCISCGVLGLDLCSRCRRSWNPHLYLRHISHGNLDKLLVHSSVIYSEVAQKIILGAKESHLKAADNLVASAIAHALGNLLKEGMVDYLIPIPSRKSAARLRGRQFITEMALPASEHYAIPMRSLLAHQRKVRDQSGLHLEERWNNMKGAFVVEGERGLPGRAVLVDDLVTTGATLVEAARALRYAGIQVIGAVTAAVAQPLR